MALPTPRGPLGDLWHPSGIGQKSAALSGPLSAPRSALVCALDWGLGHVARTSPLVTSLLDLGTQVTLASNGRSAAWWRREFPQLEVRDLPDYGVRYAPGLWLVPGLLASLPRLFQAIRHEAMLVAAWQARDHFDLILSDNRYGCHLAATRSILLTHQLHLAAPPALVRFEGLAERLMARLVRRFDEVWIPDQEASPGLSGKLGHPRHPERFPSLHYLGPLSRFSNCAFDPTYAGPWDTLALVSGPEPARSHFETCLRQLLLSRPGRHLLVRGRPDLEPPSSQANPNLVEVPHLPTKALAAALTGSREIISRGGYSTVMDLSALGLLGERCQFIPTPGQTEQEYLARHLAASGLGRHSSAV